MAAEFCPQDVDFSTLRDRIREGAEKMAENGELTVDLRALAKCNTTAICLLLALRRAAAEKNCHMEAVNISDSLRKLLNLYQISKWW